jgi:hypothetical protein
MAEWPRQSPLVKVTFGWSLAPNADRKTFEQWYLDGHVRDVVQKYGGPSMVKYVVNSVIESAATDGATTDLYREADLYFPSLDALPERFRLVPPRSDVLDHGASRVVRTLWRSEEVILKPQGRR